MDLYESTELRVTIFYEDLAAFKFNGSLLSRHTDIWNGDIIVYSPADVEVILDTKYYHMDSFR